MSEPGAGSDVVGMRPVLVADAVLVATVAVWLAATHRLDDLGGPRAPRTAGDVEVPVAG